MPMNMELLAPALGGLLVLLIAVVIWPQIGFGLFLSIYLLKVVLRPHFPFLISYTYDMTVTLVAFVGIAWHAMRVGRTIRGMIPRGFLVAWIIMMCLVWVMLPFSRQMDYGWKKALMFSVFNTLTILLPMLYFRRLEDTRGLLIICVILGLVSIVGLTFFPSIIGGTRTTFAHTDPLIPADYCTYLIVIVVSLWIAQRRLWQTILLVTLVPWGIYAIIVTGSRGPILTLPIVLLTVLFLYRRQFSLGFVVFGAVVGAMAVGITAHIVTPDMTGRFQSKVIVSGFEGRAGMANLTVRNWLSNPVLGNGTGDTAYQIGGPNFEGYPHNILLEAANELGLLGLVCMLVLFGYGIKAGVQLSRREMEGTYAKIVTVPFFGCFVHHLLSSFKTSSYAASYTFYFFLACTIALTQLWKAEQAAVSGASGGPLLDGHTAVDPSQLTGN